MSAASGPDGAGLKDDRTFEVRRASVGTDDPHSPVAVLGSHAVEAEGALDWRLRFHWLIEAYHHLRTVARQDS